MMAALATSLDLAALRADTLGVAHRAHFNNSGAALTPNPVLDAVTGYLNREAEIAA